METVEAEGKCGICGITGPLEDVEEHFLAEHIEKENINSDENEKEQLRWRKEHILLLIRLTEEKQEMFKTSMKKNVWIKIASNMSKMTGKLFTHEQVDNKWKGLKKTYKKIKDHNNKSGNDAKKWEYYYAMDSFMKNKPEIQPFAVCSSNSGLRINNEQDCVPGPSSSVVTSLPSRSSIETGTSRSATTPALRSAVSDNESSFSNDDSPVPIASQSKKRKRFENAAQKRHEDKMSRYDEFLKLFKVLVENETKNKIE